MLNPGITGLVSSLISPAKPRSSLSRYTVAVALPLAAAVLSNALFTIKEAPFFTPYTVSVLLAALYGSWRAGLVATFLSSILNWITVAPIFSVAVANPENVVRILFFTFFGVLISLLIGTINTLQHNLDFEKNRLVVTLTSIGDAVLATDTDGRITFMNPVGEQATGWTLKEAMGQPLESVFRIYNELSKAPVSNPVRKVFETGRVVGLANHTVLLRRDNTEIPIDDSAAPIRDHAGNILGAVLVFRDVTQQRNADVALLRSEKLASVGRLAATIAHEVNNPLEAVGNLLYLIRSSNEIAQVHQLADSAEKELYRAAEITKQTLSFARRENQPELIDVSELMEGVLVLYANKIRNKNVHVIKRCRAQVSAFGTRSEIRQVIGNLIANAIDAVPVDGRLHIRICGSRVGHRPVARIVVADSGHGIPRENLANIFEPFFTTKVHFGTGLGLWVTKRIIDSHDGSIRIRSRVGRGTVVVVDWPQQEAKEMTATTPV